MAVVVFSFLEHVQVYAVHLYGYEKIIRIIIKSGLFISYRNDTYWFRICAEDVYNKYYSMGNTRDISCYG